MTPEELIELIESPEAVEFLQQHASDDPMRLLLKYASSPWKKELASQMAHRQKLSRKLPGWTHNKRVLFPSGISPEQASSEHTARLKASLIQGEHLLDITGGLGVDSFYLSQRFTKTTYVERNRELALLAAHNFKVLQQAGITVNVGNGLEHLATSSADVVYADPARRGKQDQKLSALDDYEPNLLPHINLLVKNGRQSFIKTSPMLDIREGVKQFRYVQEVWVISYRNECKELVFKLQQGSENGLLKMFNIQASGQMDTFETRLDHTPNTSYADEVRAYLFEPNASILKAHATDHLAEKLALLKLHPNSQLLSGDSTIADFPGKVFLVQAVLKPYDKSLQKGRFNIISRNYPDKAEKIQQKLKIQPSRDAFIIATQNLKGKYVFIKAVWQNNPESNK